MYHPGLLDQKITFIRDTVTDDGYGGKTITGSATFQEWAFVKPLSGGESREHERQHDTGNYLFVIRTRSDILETDTIQWNGSRFNVRFPKHKSERRLYLEIEAERNAN